MDFYCDKEELRREYTALKNQVDALIAAQPKTTAARMQKALAEQANAPSTAVSDDQQTSGSHHLFDAVVFFSMSIVGTFIMYDAWSSSSSFGLLFDASMVGILFCSFALSIYSSVRYFKSLPPNTCTALPEKTSPQ